MSWFSRAKTSLAADPSGPGCPAASCWRSRSPASRATSASVHSRSSRSCRPGVRSSGRARQVAATEPDHAALARARAREAPMETRSFISVAVATFQPSPTCADPVGVGDPHVGQEHLVELGLAGELPQRPDLDAGGGHVHGEVGEALVLGHVGVGAGDQQRPPGQVRRGGPHLLPGDHPARRRRAPPGWPARPGRCPAPGSLNSWHQISSAGPQRAQPALLLLVGAVGQDRRRGHAQPDAVALRPLPGAPAAANSASTTGCRSRDRPSPPRPSG